GPNKRFYHTDIADMPHALIAGQTGGGKSNLLHVILCTLVQRATPKQLKLVLIDLKGGVELGVYRDIPHLYKFDRDDDLDAGLYGRREIVTVLAAVQREVNRRLQMFARERIRNIDRWNNKYRANRLSKIVIVIDEIANAMLVSRIKRKIEPVIADIGAQSRASGIHLVVTTQHPISDVVTSLLKANIPGRFAFSTTSISASNVIINNKKAYNLGPPGRVIYQAERKNIVAQVPYLSEDQVDDILLAVREGRVADNTVLHEVTRSDICEWCLGQPEQRFTVDNVYGKFHRFGLTYRDIRNIQGEMYASGAEVTVEDRAYILKGKGNLRFFVEVTDEK
ncbi:MAG: FtsK/SpoIIIE domain-containing protein, partial [Chloroflexota bacterium]|nr:FtsK/SpoIIIE domain-containing protein [Chloroflexota bacterium]